MSEKPEKTREKAIESGGENGRLMSIREVSDLTGVPPHTLRFWEKQMPEILSPERTPGGQRRYGSEMVEKARMIKRLSDEKRRSLASIRNQLAAANGTEEPAPGLSRCPATEQMVDLIVDEVADLLKGRLLKLLEADEPAEGPPEHDEHSGLRSPDRSRSVPEGGNEIGLDNRK